MTRYTKVLGLKIAREWDTGIMFDTGNGLVEVFTNAQEPLPLGTIRHLALATDDTDACVKAVQAAGYEVFMGPKEISIGKENTLNARVAFCYGPLGEEVEFFQEK